MADSVSTTNVWPNYAASNVQRNNENAENKKSNGTMDKDSFLRILVTQLQNQDPMEPMQDRDFIAQMAQFTSVEQLMNMANEMTMLRQNLGMASGLIGKEVQWTETDSSGVSTVNGGIVDSIVIKDGVQYLTSGASQVALDKVVSIANDGGEAQPGE